MKKAGLRGPRSRNKMALYEQLTIPSHRFKPTPVPLLSSGRAMNGSVTTLMYQPQVQAEVQALSFNNRHPYMPGSYMSPMIPSMTHMPMMNVGVYGVGSGGGGGASATSSMNASSMRSTVVDAIPESQRVPRSGEVVSRRQNSSGHSRPSPGNKDGKEDDDFAVPTYSATQASSQTRASGGGAQVQQELRGVRGGQKVLTMEKRSGRGMDEVRRMRKERNMEQDASWTSASEECVTVSAVEDDVSTQEVKNRNADGGRGDCNSEVGEERVKEPKTGGLSQHSMAITNDGDVSPEATDRLVRVAQGQDICSGQSSENQSGEVSEPSRPGSGSSAESESSMQENMTSDWMRFRELVIAFGQQEFWKAQSMIMRQQKLFARQLFELHRVIEVQQLLAKTSSLSLNIDEALVEDEVDNVPRPATPVADVPEVPEIPEADGSQSSEDNSRPVPEAVCQPMYPLSVSTQQDFNARSGWQATPFGANPWAARMASPFMYVPYPGPCPPGYGVYPTMGALMPMCGGSGGMQDARFPSWQQPGMSQPWGMQGPVAAGWYGQQPVVPAGGGVATTGAVGNSERPTSRVVSPAVRGSNASMGSGRHGGVKGDGGANCSSKVGVESLGWAKGWGGSQELVVRGEAETSQSTECGAGPAVGYEQGLREGEVERGDGGCGREYSGLESERSWRNGVNHEGSLQNGTLKRPRAEIPQAAVTPWFRVISPSKQVMQQHGVIKVVPRAVSATPESTASILLSIQKERQG